MRACPRSRRPHSAWRRTTLLLGVLAVALGGCDVPRFEGPQLQEPPQGFLLVRDSYQQRRLFPQHELVFHTAWVESLDDFSTIYIDGHPGALGLEDAMAARDSSRRYALDEDVTFGELEPLQVDGRQAWGWAERVQTPTRGLVWVAYRAIVPYDTITYAIEFYSGDPAFKGAAPDALKAVISTFAIGETTYNVPLIAVLAGLTLFVANFLRSRARARAVRLQSINLVKIPKKPHAEGIPPGPTANDPQAPGSAPASPPTPPPTSAQ